MNYIELRIRTTDEQQSEIIMAQLSEWPFESFSEEETLLCAYIRETDYPTYRDAVEAYLRQIPVTFSSGQIEDQNWNAVWEANFEPIEICGKCLIRAPFHQEMPDYAYNVVIMPKMSFGTGHHATTRLMAEEILDLPLGGLRGLDMGSGTGVLSILAMQRGAIHMDAIDIDEWAYTNSMENIAMNRLEGAVTPQQGDASLLADRHYDFVLANINRNILLSDMEAYIGTLSPGGLLVVSGILEADTACIVEKAESLGMRFNGQKTHEGWASVRFTKN